MLRAIWNTGATTYLLLRRDRIFLPVLLSALGIALFAQLASDWSVGEFSKILNDVGLLGLQLTGAFVAIFWGIKMVSDSRAEGSIEVELAAPISRSAWLIGKYLGLIFCFALLGTVILAGWQGLMLLTGFDWMNLHELAAFGFTYLEWAVLGAASLLLGCLMRQAVALFVALLAWILGLSSQIVANTLGHEASTSTKSIVRGIARIWDLQQFNLASHLEPETYLSTGDMGWRLAYGLLLILLLISLACAFFNFKDVTQQ